LSNAVVFVPAGDPDYARWLMVCGDYCNSRGYEITAVVSDWADAMTLCTTAGVDIVVTARWDHLPPDRTPRLEIVTDQRVAANPPRHFRRPRRQTWERPR